MKKILTFNRVPKDYFVTSGAGSSDITCHAGSYHLALKDAGIEMMNIMTYSSILPKIANKLENPLEIKHGEVAECIMAVAHGKEDETISAGIIYGWLYDKQSGEKFGGLVCEHNGNYIIDEIDELLRASLNELYTNGFEEKYELKDIEINIKTFVGTKKYNTALVALVFQTYEIEID